jgi:hypothetical protein
VGKNNTSLKHVLSSRIHLPIVKASLRSALLAIMSENGVQADLSSKISKLLSPSHHIKYAKRHMFEVLNIGKK